MGGGGGGLAMGGGGEGGGGLAVGGGGGLAASDGGVVVSCIGLGSGAVLFWALAVARKLASTRARTRSNGFTMVSNLLCLVVISTICYLQ